MSSKKRLGQYDTYREAEQIPRKSENIGAAFLSIYDKIGAPRLPLDEVDSRLFGSALDTLRKTSNRLYAGTYNKVPDDNEELSEAYTRKFATLIQKAELDWIRDAYGISHAVHKAVTSYDGNLVCDEGSSLSFVESRRGVQHLCGPYREETTLELELTRSESDHVSGRGLFAQLKSTSSRWYRSNSEPNIPVIQRSSGLIIDTLSGEYVTNSPDSVKDMVSQLEATLYR